MQGFGNVGSEAARLFAAAGARVVAIQDHTATLFNPTGIDMTALSAWQLEHKQIAGFPGAETIASEAFWSLDMDVNWYLKALTAQPIRMPTMCWQAVVSWLCLTWSVTPAA